MINYYTQYPSGGGFFSSNYYGPQKNVLDFALGLGLGGKWVTKRGFLFEINSGLGRNLFNSSGTEHQMVFRGGISLGYRY